MIRDKIPFLVLAILFSVITVWIYGKGGYLAAYHGGSPYTNFLAMINVFVEYVIYLVVPVYLDHYYWTAIPQSIFSRQVLLSIAAIFLMGVLAWRSFRKERIFFFWLGWFFISLLPVLNIVPLVILRADRYMYLPAIGLFYLVSWGLWKISRVEYRPFRLPVFLFCSFLVAGTYAFLTLERNKLWKDPLIFWEESLRKFPQSVAPYVYIGGIYAREGKDDLATSYYRSGLRENPNNVALLNGLAIAYKNKNELKKAEDLLEQASRLNPEDGGTYNNLGIVFFKKGDIEKARIYLQKALEIDPQNAAARTNLGVIFYRQKQWEEATRQFEKALDPPLDSIEPYLNLGLIYEQKKLLDKAESYLKKALDYDPRSYSALFLLGRVSLEKGNILQARFYLSQAHRLKPDDGDTNYFLGWITQREADDYFQKAMKRSPPAQAKFIEPSMNIHVRP